MVTYRFDCDTCDDTEDVDQPMSNDPPQDRGCTPGCGGMLRRVWGAQVQVFRPFTTSHITGSPTEFTSTGQRDAELAAQGLTLDTGRYVHPPSKPAAVKKVDFNQVKQIIREGRHEAD